MKPASSQVTAAGRRFYNPGMSQLRITELARRTGLNALAIRYYERIGVLPPAQRVSGVRRYDEAALTRLAVLQRARQTGFSLAEIRELLLGFASATPASVRWQRLAGRKLTELQRRIDDLQAMRTLLQRMDGCRCSALEECGRAIMRGDAARKAAVPPGTKRQKP